MTEADKLDLIKKKVTIKKVKRKATAWEKAFTIRISHKGCLSRKHKELYKSVMKRQNQYQKTGQKT